MIKITQPAKDYMASVSNGGHVTLESSLVDALDLSISGVYPQMRVLMM